MTKLINKLVLFSMVAFMLTAFFTLIAHAVEGAAPDLGLSVLALIDAVKVGKVAVIMVAAVQLLKTEFFGSLIAKINQKAIPWITLAIAVVGNVGASVIQGKSWVAALVEGVLISLTANGAYETIKSIK